MRRHRTAAALTTGLSAAVVLVLGACSGRGGPGDGGSTTTTPTVTVTVTRTVPAPAPTSRTAPPTVPTTPPPADDPRAIPDDPRAYAGAFVTAWAKRDRTRAEQLATAAVVKTAFASSVSAPPRPRGCEGAAGSTSCTYEGEEYTMTVRVLNEPASRRQPHAVTEVRFGH